MGRGKQLNEFEKGQITALNKSGENISRISSRIGRSRHVIAEYLQNPVKYGTKKNPGRPQKLSPREKRRILNIASNSSKSCKQIAAACDVNVTRQTVWNVLNGSPHLKSARLKPCPMLKPCHIKARLQFARSYGSWTHEWQQVNC